MSAGTAHRPAQCVRTLPLLAAVLAALLLPGARFARATPSRSAPVHRLWPIPAAIPLSFEVNRGQAGPGIGFIAHGSGYAAFLSAPQVTFELLGAPSPARMADMRFSALIHAVSPPPPLSKTARLRFLGANPHAHLVGLHRLTGVVNYLLGDNPRQWRTNIPTYASVEVRNLYPGVDLVYFSRNGQLEYDWLLHPGARAGAIRLQLTGAGRPRLTRNGALALNTAAGTLIQRQPIAYQLTPHGRRYVRVAYARNSRSGFGLRVGRQAAGEPLIIDPVVAYATYLVHDQAAFCAMRWS
jgi:hypothetical protein